VTLIIIGTAIEGSSALIILTPVLMPLVQKAGIDPVQFGVIMVLNLIIGTITPPVGVVLFVVMRIAELSFETMARAILPWLVPLLVVLQAISMWPPLTLWLPRLVMG
jgi:TRAP-type C4-dicarboxylate transport system permease large subunit